MRTAHTPNHAQLSLQTEFLSASTVAFINSNGASLPLHISLVYSYGIASVKNRDSLMNAPRAFRYKYTDSEFI